MKTLNEFFELGMKRELLEIVQPPQGELALNVGCGKSIIKGAIGIDYPEWDADKQPLPYRDSSVGCIYAFHFLEHVREPVRVLQDFQRVLVKGGVVNIVVPYYSSQIMAQDLDHKSSFSEETWKTLFRNQYYDKNEVEWKFEIGVNVIMGVVERNLSLLTQLIKTSS